MGEVEKRFKAGACAATVFANEQAEGKDVLRSVSLQRVYKDREANFKYTTSFHVRDVPKAILVLCRAYAHLALEERDPQKAERDAA